MISICLQTFEKNVCIFKKKFEPLIALDSRAPKQALLHNPRGTLLYGWKKAEKCFNVALLIRLELGKEEKGGKGVRKKESRRKRRMRIRREKSLSEMHLI